MTREPRVRRLASLAVLIVAGLASLATTQIPHADDDATGQTSVGPDGAQIHVEVRVERLLSGEGERRFDLELRGQWSDTPTGAVEVQLLGPGDDPMAASWQRLPISVELPVETCPTSCTVPYEIRMRTPASGAGIVIVPWRMYAYIQGDVSSVELVLTELTSGPSAAQAAAQGAAVGIGVGLLVALLSLILRVSPSTRLALLEAIAAGAMIVSGLMVAEGLRVGLVSGVVGIFALIGGLTVAASILWHKPRLSRPTFWLVPIALVSPPVLLARFTVAGEFRVNDVLATSGAAGFAVAVAALLVIAALVQIGRSSVDLASPRVVLTFVISGATAFVTYGWSLMIAAGVTNMSVLTIVPLGAIFIGIALALWRWLKGDCVTPFIVGVFTPLVALVAFAGVAFSMLAYLFVSSNPEAALAMISLVPVALGGILMAVLAFLPPRRLDGRGGSPLQAGWEAVDLRAGQAEAES